MGWRVALSGAVVAGVTLCAGLLFARPTLDSYDAQIMFAVAKSMATTHTTYVPPEVDPFHLSSPHSSYGLGMSILMAVTHLAAQLTGRDPQRLAMLINPVLFGAIAITLLAWARIAGATPVRAAAVSLATAFGALLLPYVPTGGAELGTALGVALCLLGVELASRRPVVGGLVAGVGASVAVLMRPDSAALIAAPVAIALLCQARWALPPYVLAAAPGAVVTAAYNLGAGLHYQGLGLRQAFSHPWWSGVEGLLISPGRGLLLYAPVVILALVAVPWAWRRSPVVTVLCLALLVDRVLFYAGWFAWHGGWAWGPRFLVPAMPALAPLLLEPIRAVSLRRWYLAVPVVPVMVLSMSVQLLGAAVRYETDSANLAMTAAAPPFAPDMSNFAQVATSQSKYAAEDRVLFDWRYFPIAEHARDLADGRQLASRRLAPLFRQGQA